MDIREHQLQQAAQQGIITHTQVQELWAFLSTQSEQGVSFKTSHILYYLGGLIAIGAMSLFMNLGWERFGGWGLFFIALAYMGAGLWLTRFFLNRNLFIPAGILAAFVVVLAPLAVYGIQLALDLWADGRVYRDYHRYIDWRWLMMEFATLAVGVAILWRHRLPFSMMPVAVTLWYISMDLTPFLFQSEDYQWELRKFISMWFGLLMMLVAFWVDIRTKQPKDFAFWLYLFGVLAFWGGLSSMNSDSELNKFIYFCINLLLITVGAVLSRRVFAIFGGFGVAIYLSHLAYSVFKDSMLFPFALTVIGLAVIFVGVYWQRHEQKIAEALKRYLPVALREMIEKRH